MLDRGKLNVLPNVISSTQPLTGVNLRSALRSQLIIGLKETAQGGPKLDQFSF